MNEVYLETIMTDTFSAISCALIMQTFTEKEQRTEFIIYASFVIFPSLDMRISAVYSLTDFLLRYIVLLFNHSCIFFPDYPCPYKFLLYNNLNTLTSDSNLYKCGGNSKCIHEICKFVIFALICMFLRRCFVLQSYKLL